MAKLDFIENPEAEEPVAAEVVETPPEPVTPEVVAPAEVAPEPVEAAKPEGVPLPTFLDMRDKLKAAERRAAEAEARVTPEPTVQIPDIFEDPEGHNAAIQAQIDARLYQQSLVMSERFAVQQYGKEATQAALEWGKAKCGSDPYFNAQVRQSNDPVGFAVQEYQRDQIANAVTPDEFQKFQAWQAAQAQIAPPTPPNQPPIPPRSIAAIPSAGGVSHVPVGPGVAFDGLFQG